MPLCKPMHTASTSMTSLWNAQSSRKWLWYSSRYTAITQIVGMLLLCLSPYDIVCSSTFVSQNFKQLIIRWVLSYINV